MTDWSVIVIVHVKFMTPQIGKEKLLSSALTLFSKQGFHETSVSQIAKAAAVSKGLTYNYFKSKEELLLAIINKASEDMFTVAEGMTTTGGYQMALHNFLKRYGVTLKTNKTYLSFQLSLLFEPSLKKIVQVPLQQRANQLLSLTVTMFEKAGTNDATPLARRFISELDGIALHYLSVFENYPLDEMLIQLYQNYKDISQ